MSVSVDGTGIVIRDGAIGEAKKGVRQCTIGEVTYYDATNKVGQARYMRHLVTTGFTFGIVVGHGYKAESEFTCQCSSKK